MFLNPTLCYWTGLTAGTTILLYETFEHEHEDEDEKEGAEDREGPIS